MMLALLSMTAPLVSADVPTVTLSTSDSGGDTILEITVTHHNPSSSHFIDLIEVEVTNASGSATYQVTPPTTPQPVTFTVNYNLGPITESNTISSRANCNVHGWSTSATLTLNPNASAPDAPRGLLAVAGDGRVTLTWQPPQSDGGSSVTGYMIYRGTSPGAVSLLTTVGNVLVYADTGLENNQTYYYKVSAVNAAGESVQSNQAIGIPSVAVSSGSGDQTVLIAAGVVGVALLVVVAVLFLRRKR
jgi:desulfoferrodoxin (superoxide reductase-like protein)